MDSQSLSNSFLRLVEVMAELREKCPWDRKQTINSLRHLTIEEAYELTDSILDMDFPGIKEELGDLMLHLIFYSHIASEKGEFNIEDVLKAQVEKLIRRHPHIYGDMQGATEKEISENWERIKAKEKAELAKQGRLRNPSTLDGVPRHLPSLIKAYRMQEKASNVGFDWPNKDEVWLKVKEEIEEFEQASTSAEKEEEMGDLLFSLVNYCRFSGINPEDALARSNEKFKTRFTYIEEMAKKQTKDISELSLDEMESYWQEAKVSLEKR